MSQCPQEGQGSVPTCPQEGQGSVSPWPQEGQGSVSPWPHEGQGINTPIGTRQDRDQCPDVPRKDRYQCPHGPRQGRDPCPHVPRHGRDQCPWGPAAGQGGDRGAHPLGDPSLLDPHNPPMSPILLSMLSSSLSGDPFSVTPRRSAGPRGGSTPGRLPTQLEQSKCCNFEHVRK